MADNIAITAGTGTAVHADEYTHATLGSGKTQLVKLVDGTLDSSTAIAAGGGVEAGALRVTVASDSTGVLSVDDNGDSLTIDGTVTANLSATDNAVLDDIASDTEAIKTSLAGTLTVTGGGGGVEYTEGDTDASITGSAAMMEVAANTLQPIQGTVADGLLVNLGGNNDVTVASVSGTVTTKGIPSDIDINGSNANHADKYYTNAGAVTDGIVWSPAAGKRWHVLTLYINVSAAATITLEDDLAGGDVARWKGELAANSGVVLKYDKEHPFCSGEDAADLIITTTAGNVYVQAVGYEI